MFEITGVAGTGVTLGVGGPATDPVEGRPYFIVCRNIDGAIVYQQLITYQPGANTVDAATLARQAYRELPLLYPQPFTAPPANVSQLVGVRTWFWIDQTQWQPRDRDGRGPRPVRHGHCDARCGPMGHGRRHDHHVRWTRHALRPQPPRQRAALRLFTRFPA